MKLSGKNFQSWTNFSLDISGLTVIIGPSNKGKSAIFRALRGLFRNELPAEYVRSGSSGLELSADVDGKLITATRGTKGSTKYKIGTQEFAKLNQTVPPELKAFGMNEVEVGDFIIDPIFARQNGKQFLIDPEGYSPTELNTILGAFASTEKLESGKKAANLEVSRKNSEAKTLAEEILESKNREDQLQAFKLESEDIAVGLKARVGVVEDIETKAVWMRAAFERQQVIEPLRLTLASLQVPDASEAERLSTAFDYAVQATNNFRLSRFYKRTSDATQSVYDSLRDVIRIHNAVAYLREIETSSPDVSKLKDFMNLLKLVIANADTRFAEIKLLQDRIILLSTVPGLRQEVEALAGQRKGVEADLEQIQKDIEALSKTLTQCPKCGHKFDTNHAERLQCFDMESVDLPEDYEVN